MTIPVESSEVCDFTPASLSNLIDPPVFRLRAPDERNMRRYNQMCGDDNLTLFSDKQFDAEKRFAIGKLWGDDAQPILDRYKTIRASVEQQVTVSDDDAEWIQALDNQLFDNWSELARMRRKNDEWFEYSPRYAIATIVRGWKNLNVQFQLDAGYLKTSLVRNIGNELVALEEKAREDGIEGIGTNGTAFVELWMACLGRTRLSEDEEKNSPAPSQPSSNQEDSTATVQQDGASIEESGADSSTSSSSAQKKTH